MTSSLCLMFLVSFAIKAYVLFVLFYIPKSQTLSYGVFLKEQNLRDPLNGDKHYQFDHDFRQGYRYRTIPHLHNETKSIL